MSCDTPKTQLFLYLDGELAASEGVAIEHHLQTCEHCQREAAMHQRLQTLLRTTLSEEEVPEHLWANIRHKLPAEPPGARQPSAKTITRRVWVGGIAAAALLMVLFGGRMWLANPVDTVVQEIVDSQIRAQLMQAGYQQIPDDAGEIRRWFHDKVAFAVLVPHVPNPAYTFRGVRLNYFLDRHVAEIAYASPNYALSFLMFPDKDIALKSMHVIRTGDRVFYVQDYKGYNTVLWRDGQYFCSLVSDLNLQSLLQIARQATGSGSTS